MARSVFLSDVHLSDQRPGLTRQFLAFLDTLRGNTDRLYLLGDLFDFWMGPAHLAIPEHWRTLEKLRELTAGGMEVHFVHGNRDFHVAREFARATGVQVVGEGEAVVFGAERVWLTHGDNLCTDDIYYGIWRRFSRARWAVALYRALPVSVTLAIARLARSASRKNAAHRDGHVQEPAPAALRRAFRAGFDRIICGHFHRASTRAFDTPDCKGTLMVLGEWNGVGSYIEWDGEAFRHREVDLQAPAEAR